LRLGKADKVLKPSTHEGQIWCVQMKITLRKYGRNRLCLGIAHKYLFCHIRYR